MLTSLKKQRSVRSIRSLLQSSTEFDTEMISANASTSLLHTVGEPILKVLHLSPSLPSPDNISPGLWTWIHTAGGWVDPDVLHLAVAHTRLYSANGEPSEIPDHLADVGGNGGVEDVKHFPGARPLPGMARPALTRSMSTLNTQPHSMRGGKVTRRPVTAIFGASEPETPKIRRLYLQLDELRLKSSTNAQAVVCRLQIGRQKPCTVILNLRKEASKGLGLVVHAKEGFIIDSEEDTRVALRIYSLSNNARFSSDSPHMSSSPSLDLMANAADPSILRPKLGLLSGLRRSPTASSMAHAFSGSGSSTPTRMPSSAAVDAGTLLGETVFNIPTHTTANHNKISGEYSVMSANGKKEIAKLTLQMGVFLDEEYSIEPEAELIPPEPEFGDFLNFLINTSGASIWRKYWCVLRDNELQIYDFEYREIKPVSSIPLRQILQVHPADPELMYAPYCVELVLSPNVTSTDTVIGWTASILDEKPGSSDIVAYATADSKKRMVDWMDKIAREKARQAGAGTPVPPPRKMVTSKPNRKPVAAVALAREAAY